MAQPNSMYLNLSLVFQVISSLQELIVRGTVSKGVTNGSKTAVMEVVLVSLLCVPLGSSTVQLHDSRDSRRACENSEVGFMLEGILPKSRVLLCVLCRQKDSMQRIFVNKCFLFMAGSVSRVKRYNGSLMTIRLK
jgi:hypothetical protein